MLTRLYVTEYMTVRPTRGLDYVWLSFILTIQSMYPCIVTERQREGREEGVILVPSTDWVTKNGSGSHLPCPRLAAGEAF